MDVDAGHHVEVSEQAATTNEGLVGFGRRQGFILLVAGQGFAVAHRVVALVVVVGGVAGNFPGDSVLAILAAARIGDQVPLGAAGVDVGVGVVDHRCRLVGADAAGFKANRAIGQAAETEAEVLIYGQAQEAMGNVGIQVGYIGLAQAHRDQGVVENAFKHGRETVLGHRLEGIGEVAIVPVPAHRQTGPNGGF